MSEIYKLSGFQQELFKAERFFTMHLTRQELKNRLDEIERLNKQVEEYQKALDETVSEKIDLENIIKEAREYIDWHYDLGTKENVEFCLLRDRLLGILDKGE